MYSTAKDRFQNLKVFPLPFWARPIPWTHGDGEYLRTVQAEVPADVRTGRHGLFVDKKAGAAWVEGPRGAHYITLHEHYLRELDECFHKPLTDRVFAALKVLRSEGLLSEDQGKALYHESSLRGSFLRGSTVKTRFLQFCKNKKIKPKIEQLPLP